MKLYTVKSEGLAHNSYMLIDSSEAAVIDPRRDCKSYLTIASKNCAKIKYVFETHRNEDYIVGSRDLQNLTNAEICHSKELAFKYGEHNIDDGEEFKVGNLKISSLLTPGHTDESLCYVVSNMEKSADPLLIFSGDTLFVGSIGRTELQGKEAQPKMAENLFESLHEKLIPLDDHVLVYPAHGSGSVCGSKISEQAFTTLGYEKKTNPYLKLSKEDFVRRSLATELIVPPYFHKMEEYNLKGAPLLHGLTEPKALSIAEFEAEMNESDSIVVDTRLPNAFAGSHITNSLNIWLGGGTAVYIGWVVSYSQKILLVMERNGDLRRVAKHLWRLGFDNVIGYLCPEINEWQNAGKTTSHVHTLSATDLHSRLERYVVLDVREPSEWHEEGIIERAETIFFGDLQSKADNLDRNKRYAVICSVGNRASLGASILKRKGFVGIGNVLGGMTAWENLGYPTKKKQPLSLKGLF